MGSPGQMPLRMLAPLALGLFAIGLIVVVIASLGGSSSSDGRDRAETREERTRGQRESRARRRTDGTSAGTTLGTTAGSSSPSGTSAGRRFYVVKGGDTLGTIAQATGVPIDELLTLNPSVDPQALVSGQRIKLRE